MNTDEHEVTKEPVLEKSRGGFTLPEKSSSSSSSSPSHEFSFAVSVRPCSSSDILSSDGKTESESPCAVDLSPADEIFFHGHLLPLQLLSHLPVSPSSFSNSEDSFAHPTKESSDDQKYEEAGRRSSNSKHNNVCDKSSGIISRNHGNNGRKSFKLFGLLKWRKVSESSGGEKEKKTNQTKMPRFELSRTLKRYVSVVRPALLFFRRSFKGQQFPSEAYYSYSGNLSLRHDKRGSRGRRGEHSVPVSPTNSPKNSGLLVATKSLPSPASDSSVDELQAAIQAAIAHCKNSFAFEESVK